MKNVCIIGSGSWGCALAIHAAKIGHNVKIWSFAQKEADLINKEINKDVVKSFDLVELNPLLDKNRVTEEIATQIIERILK